MAFRTDGNQRWSWMKNRPSPSVELDAAAYFALQYNHFLPERGILSSKLGVDLKGKPGGLSRNRRNATIAVDVPGSSPHQIKPDEVFGIHTSTSS